MKTIAVVNQKGGVGKTTTVINLGTGLARLGKRVLLVDFDPQGNMSAGLGADLAGNEKNIYRALVDGEALAEQIVATEIENLAVVPTDSDLAGAEVELVQLNDREFRLKKALAGLAEAGVTFDYVLIDCPPSLGLLTLNALCAADSYLVPMQAEFFAMQGLVNLMGTVEQVKVHLNPRLREEGILVTMFDSRSNFSKQVNDDIRSFGKDRVFVHIIPRRIRLAESTSHGKPGIVYDPNCMGARSYVELAKEFMARERGEQVKTSVLQRALPPDPVDRLGANNRQTPSERSAN